jgi:hypothetical protein
MPPVVLMRGIPLSSGYSSSAAVLIVDRKLEIDFDLTCSAGPSTVKYFIEYSEDLVTWFPEVAEENAGKGVVSMPKAVRTFADNNATSVANNASFRVSCQFTRLHQFARIQIAAASGTVVVNSAVVALGAGPFGSVTIGVASGPDCTPGQVLFDSGVLPTVHNVNTSSGAPQSFEIPTGLTFPSCTNFQLQVFADLQNQFPGPITTAVHAIMNDSGLDIPSHAFLFGPPTPTLDMAFFPTPIDGAYHSLVASVYPTNTPLYGNFAGPIVNPQSLYFWPPPEFPGFHSGNYDIKNIRILITTV